MHEYFTSDAHSLTSLLQMYILSYSHHNTPNTIDIRMHEYFTSDEHCLTSLLKMYISSYSHHNTPNTIDIRMQVMHTATHIHILLKLL